jgi:hypothetical protein
VNSYVRNTINLSWAKILLTSVRGGFYFETFHIICVRYLHVDEKCMPVYFRIIFSIFSPLYRIVVGRVAQSV